MKKFAKLLLLLGVTGFGFANCVIAAPEAPIISDARINVVAQEIQQHRGMEVTAEQLKQIKTRLQQSDILKNMAIAKGLDKEAEYQAQLQNMQSMLLSQRLIADYAKKNPATLVEVRTAYEKMIAVNSTKKSYLVKHILFKTQDEADDAIKLLRKGKPFESLARKESTDEGSRDNGGSLGWITPDMVDPAFSAAMVKLSKGQVTNHPVKSSAGWHIIKLDDIRSEKQPTLEQITPQLKQQIMQDKMQKYIDGILKSAGVNN